MAEWKKVIVSGSIAELNQVTASGGFSGNGSGLTGITADTLGNSLTDGNGIADFTFNGSSGATIAVEADGSTLSVGASGVKVADAGITATQIATSVAGDGLAGGGGTALSVGVDDSTVEINTDTVRVKDAGITLAKQANMAADRIQGRANGAGTGVPQALTAAQVRAIINVEDGATADQDLSGLQASLTFGIANTNAVKIDDADAANGDYAKFTATGLQGRDASEVLSDIGAQASLTFGIANTNAVKIDHASVADNDYAKFTANGLEGRSFSEVLTDLGIEAGATADQTGAEIATALNSDLGGDFTIGNQSDDTATFSGDVTVNGDLTVGGTTTTVNTETINLADNFIVLNSNLGDSSAPSQDSGIQIKRGSSTDATYFWDETVDRWSFALSNIAADGTAATPDAFVATVETSTSAPSSNPVYGGTSGHGNMHVKTDTGEIFIYA